MEHILMLNNMDQKQVYTVKLAIPTDSYVKQHWLEKQSTKRITTSQLKPLIRKKTTAYGVENSCPGIEQAEQMWRG